MRIGLVIYGSLDARSGGFLYDRRLVAHLRSQGDQVEVLSLPWRSYPRHISDNLRLGFADWIAAQSYDLLLQDELNHPSLFLLNSYLRRRTRAPIIGIVHHLRSQEHHPRIWQKVYRAVEHRYLNTLDGFIYNSRTTARIVARHLTRSRPGITAYPGADHLSLPSRQQVISMLEARMHRTSPIHLLFVGNIDRRKGLHTVLAACANLPPDGWHLHIVGNTAAAPDYVLAMHRLAQKLSLTYNLTWHGRVSDVDLQALYTSADLLVLPSYEGFGITYLEAMAFGLPVIASTVGAAPELIRSGYTGALVTPGDTAALADVLHRLQNRVQLANLGYHARLRFEKHPTWSASMHSAYQFLHEVTAQ